VVDKADYSSAFSEHIFSINATRQSEKTSASTPGLVVPPGDSYRQTEMWFVHCNTPLPYWLMLWFNSVMCMSR